MKKSNKNNPKKNVKARNILPLYCIDNIYVSPSPVGGRGVFAAKDFSPGDTIEISPVLNIDRNTNLLDYTDLYNYVFSTDGGRVILGLGYTSLYNHSFSPSAEFTPCETLILITAIKFITKGSEIFVDYNWTEESYLEAGII